MAKQKPSGNYVALEIKALESKIAEFRKYLDNTKIANITEYEERHAEIKVQILIMEKLTPIIGQLDNLKKQADKELDDKQAEQTRGDVVLSPLEEGLID